MKAPLGFFNPAGDFCCLPGLERFCDRPAGCQVEMKSTLSSSHSGWHGLSSGTSRSKLALAERQRNGSLDFRPLSGRQDNTTCWADASFGLLLPLLHRLRAAPTQLLCPDHPNCSRKPKMCQRAAQQGQGKKGIAPAPQFHSQRAKSSPVPLTVLSLLPDDALQVHAGARLAGAEALGLGGQGHVAGIHPHGAGAYHDLLARRRDVVVDHGDEEVQGQHRGRGDRRLHLQGKRNRPVTTGRGTSINRQLHFWRTSSPGQAPGGGSGPTPQRRTRISLVFPTPACPQPRNPAKPALCSHADHAPRPSAGDSSSAAESRCQVPSPTASAGQRASWPALRC